MDSIIIWWQIWNPIFVYLDGYIDSAQILALLMHIVLICFFNFRKIDFTWLINWSFRLCGLDFGKACLMSSNAFFVILLRLQIVQTSLIMTWGKAGDCGLNRWIVRRRTRITLEFYFFSLKKSLSLFNFWGFGFLLSMWGWILLEKVES